MILPSHRVMTSDHACVADARVFGEKAKKKPGILNARQVYQGGFTSGRRRTPLGALGMPGRAPGKDRNSVREKTLYHAAVCTAVVRGAR